MFGNRDAELQKANAFWSKLLFDSMEMISCFHEIFAWLRRYKFLLPQFGSFFAGLNCQFQGSTFVKLAKYPSAKYPFSANLWRASAA